MKNLVAVLKMKSTLVIILAMFLAVGLLSASANATSMTIATFSDPSANSTNPLFTLTSFGIGGTLSGQWLQDGLTLEIPYNSNTIENVYFTMDTVTITDVYGSTTGGFVTFFKTGENNPLILIEFDSGSVSRFGVGADEMFAANIVNITGSQITGPLADEQFSFSFANKAKSPTNKTGFTATASFTSSATVPEPATVGILSIGALSLLRRKNTK